MAVCDLSSRNPNVLFELALRQAFDKPVALIQEKGTSEIFDIAPLRCTEYRRERIYHEVLEDQKAISNSLKETFEAHGKGPDINSIVKLLALNRPASVPDIAAHDAASDTQQLILAGLSQLRDEVRSLRGATGAAEQGLGRVRLPLSSKDRRGDPMPLVQRVSDALASAAEAIEGGRYADLPYAEIDLMTARQLMDFLTSLDSRTSRRGRNVLQDLAERLEFLEDELNGVRCAAKVQGTADSCPSSASGPGSGLGSTPEN